MERGIEAEFCRRYQAKAEARDQALDVAILLGAPPEVFLGACASVPYEADEMAIANAIRGGAMPMRPWRCWRARQHSMMRSSHL